jgi:hypothetical protein
MFKMSANSPDKLRMYIWVALSQFVPGAMEILTSASKNRQHPSAKSVHCGTPPIADLEQLLLGWSKDIQIDCYLIKSDGMPIGFFALDFSYDRHRSYLFETEHFGVLRCFFIDQRFQGKGFSKSSLAYPDVLRLLLTVNFKNKPAIHILDRRALRYVIDPI